MTCLASAEVKLPQIIADHMILQRGVDVAIWGWADQGEQVTVQFAGQTKKVNPDGEGRWQIKLDPLKASKKGRSLTVKGKNTVVVKDVLVGEIWLASGQSNMVSGIKQVPGDERAVYAANKSNDMIRLFKADGRATRELTNDTGGRWMLTSEQNLGTSAVGFFFAHKLYQELDVPVAYIIIANLGSKIEPFIPVEEFAPLNSIVRGSSNTYNSMIAPMTSYAIKGAIWYQGESNQNSDNYFECIKALSAGWSRAFSIPNIPLHQVQIAPYSKAKNRTSVISDYVWAAQQKAAKEIKGVTVIPIHDTDIHVTRIHPRHKKPVGERLAAQALKNQYGKKVITTGPTFANAIRTGDKVIVSFDNIDKGLATKDGNAPTFFELSDDGRAFFEAAAVIDGNKVVLRCGKLRDPKFVRMGWYDIAIPTLMDKNGWPALAFPIKGVVMSAVSKQTKFPKGFEWKSEVPKDCPFELSKTLTGIYFTGKHSDYKLGDTFYPSWASDGNMYSPWTDGPGCGSGGSMKNGYHTAHVVMEGDDPLTLEITNTSPPKRGWAAPYRGRYPCGSLVHDGIWYYGTYCLGPGASYGHEGFRYNWPNLGPMPGFQISYDLGKTWTDSPHTAEKPLFPEPAEFMGPVKIGAPHFVDFGKNMEHSPDGKAYLLGMGAVENDPKPRPCITAGEHGTVYKINETCAGRVHLGMRSGEKKSEFADIYEKAFKQVDGKPFAHANLSWITADQVYLTRVTPSPKTINDLKSYEFFAGHDKDDKPLWTSDFAKIKPLIEWNNNMGCVTATYVPALKKYLMCITDGWPTVAKMDSYILEADKITGPWRIVVYMKGFGEQAYFLNFPSKFISGDGKSMWMCYSANFSNGWNGVDLKFNPPGGRYGLCLHEVKLLTPADAGQTAK